MPWEVGDDEKFERRGKDWTLRYIMASSSVKSYSGEKVALGSR